MNRSGVRRIIPILLVLMIAILIIAVIFSVIRMVSGGTSDQPVATLDTSQEQLLNTGSEHKVRMTIRGPIVGNEDFRSYDVVVTPSSREFTRFSGYIRKPLADKSYSNNVKAYDEFVHALAKANLTKGVALDTAADDTRGVCATGALYEFEIINGSDVVKHLWTSTCKGSAGSLDADAAQLQELFLAQVPGARQYIGKD